MRGQERNVVTRRAGVTGSRHCTFSGASVDFRASGLKGGNATGTSVGVTTWIQVIIAFCSSGNVSCEIPPALPSDFVMSRIYTGQCQYPSVSINRNEYTQPTRRRQNLWGRQRKCFAIKPSQSKRQLKV